MPTNTETAYELLQRVHQFYSGAQRNFVIARLQLRSGLVLADLNSGDPDPQKAKLLGRAIAEVCPEVNPTQPSTGGAR